MSVCLTTTLLQNMASHNIDIIPLAWWRLLK